MKCSWCTSKAAADGEAVENVARWTVAILRHAGGWRADPSNSGPKLDLGAWLLIPWQFTQQLLCLSLLYITTSKAGLGKLRVLPDLSDSFFLKLCFNCNLFNFKFTDLSHS